MPFWMILWWRAWRAWRVQMSLQQAGPTKAKAKAAKPQASALQPVAFLQPEDGENAIGIVHTVASTRPLPPLPLPPVPPLTPAC